MCINNVKFIDNKFIKSVTNNCKDLKALSVNYALDNSIDIHELLFDLNSLNNIKYLDFGFNEAIIDLDIQSKFPRVKCISLEEKKIVNFNVEYMEDDKDFKVRIREISS